MLFSLIWLSLAYATQIFSGDELVAAISTAGENFAGTLRANITLNLTNHINFRGTFTLDGNGQTLRCSGGIDPLMVFAQGSNVMVQNLFFQSCPVGFLNATNSTVVLDNCNLLSTGPPVLISTIDCDLQLQACNMSSTSETRRTVQAVGGSLRCERSQFGPQNILARTTGRVELSNSVFSGATVRVQDTKCINGTLAVARSLFSDSSLAGSNLSSALLSGSEFDASPVSLTGHGNKCNTQVNGSYVCPGPTCCTPCGLHAGLPYGRQGSGNGYFNITHCAFRRASTSALYLYWHHSHVHASLFESNEARAGSGGAMYCGLEDSTALVQACTLTNNSARDRGGAIYFKDSSWPSQVLDCCFHNNSAPLGGSLFYTDAMAGPHLVNGSGFFGSSGAAVWVEGQGQYGAGPMLTLSQSTLAGNDRALDVTFSRAAYPVLSLDAVTLAYNTLPGRLTRPTPPDRLSNVTATNTQLLAAASPAQFFDCLNWTVWDASLGDLCAPVPAASEPVHHFCLTAALPGPLSSTQPLSSSPSPATSQLLAPQPTPAPTPSPSPTPSQPPLCSSVVVAGNCSQNGNSTTVVGNATVTGSVSLTGTLNITNDFNLNSQALLISVATGGSPLLIVGGCADLTGRIVLDLSQLTVDQLNGASLGLVSSACVSGTPEIELENGPDSSCLSVVSTGSYAGGLYSVTLSLVDSCSSEDLALLTTWQIALAALGGVVVLVVLALITYLLCARDKARPEEDELPNPLQET